MSSRSVQIIGGEDRQHAFVTDANRLQVESIIGDSPNLDAFHRVRISNPTGLFESTATYDKQPLLWNEETVGTATSVHLPNESSVLMSVSANGDSVVRQSRNFFRYQPGKSQMVYMTFVCGTGDANVRKRIGYFSTENGVFLEEINGSVWAVIRSKTSGSVVDTRIAQSNWNLDTYSDLDITKAHIWAMDLEWLGVGRVRVGFVDEGKIRYVHEFLHANLIDAVYMTSAQLPVRSEVVATGVPSASNDFKVICASVISEGGQDEHIGFPFSVANTSTTSITGARTPILTIQPKATFNGIDNHVQVIQRGLGVFNAGNAGALVEVIYDGTLTGASFASVDPSSVMEFDTAATAISGGIVVLSFFVPASVQSKTSERSMITGRLPLSRDLNNLNPTALTITVTNFGTVSAAGSFNWQEYR
jgi:hypothetical protein